MDRAQLRHFLEKSFGARGHSISAVFPDGNDLMAALQAARDDDGSDAVLAAGGDGTISAAASVLQGTGKPLAVLPGGNMNLYARTLGIPLEVNAAVRALAAGSVAKADVAFANDRCFIHEFSLGLHPEMIELRDQQKFGSRVGKFVGSLRSLTGILMRPPRVRVWVSDDGGGQRPILTPLLAVSSNPYGDGHLPYADRIDEGVLGVYVARTVRSSELAALTALMALGNWDERPNLDFRTAQDVRLTRRGRIKAAIDGELVHMKSPINIRIEPAALSVIVPREEDAIRGQ
jgi:diacylglycerol kinase family enzyme